MISMEPVVSMGKERRKQAGFLPARHKEFKILDLSSISTTNPPAK